MNYQLVINNKLCCVEDQNYPSRTKEFYKSECNNIKFEKPDESVISRLKTLYDIFELHDSYYVEFHEPDSYSVEYTHALDIEAIIKKLNENNFKLKQIYAGDGWITLDIQEIKI